MLKFPATAVTFSSKNSLLFICDKKKSTIFMANLRNPVCAIVIAGPKAGICSPKGILTKGNHLIVLKAGSKSGLKLINIKQLLNKNRALLQLDTNDDVDSQHDQTQDSSRISSSRKVKVNDVFVWTTTECGEVMQLVSLTTDPNSENEDLGINISK